MTTTIVTLRQLRAEKGLSIRQAEQEIGLSRGVLNRAERAEGIHPSHAKKIAEFYGVSVTDIWPVEPAHEAVET